MMMMMTMTLMMAMMMAMMMIFYMSCSNQPASERPATNISLCKEMYVRDYTNGCKAVAGLQKTSSRKVNHSTMVHMLFDADSVRRTAMLLEFSRIVAAWELP